MFSPHDMLNVFVWKCWREGGEGREDLWFHNLFTLQKITVSVMVSCCFPQIKLHHQCLQFESWVTRNHWWGYCWLVWTNTLMKLVWQNNGHELHKYYHWRSSAYKTFFISLYSQDRLEILQFQTVGSFQNLAKISIQWAWKLKLIIIIIIIILIMRIIIGFLLM